MATPEEAAAQALTTLIQLMETGTESHIKLEAARVVLDHVRPTATN